MFIIVARAIRPALYHDRYITMPCTLNPGWDVDGEKARKYASREEAEADCATLPKDTSSNHYDYEVEEA